MNFLLDIDDSDITYIMNQAPDGASRADITKAYLECNKDVVATLAKIWQLPQHKAPAPPCDKWGKIREICNNYEHAMENHIKGNVSE